MPGKKLTLEMPEVAAVIDERYRREPDGRRKTRLLAVKLVAEGELASGKIAELCGISRGRLFVWLAVLRERGLEALLARGKPGPRAGTCRDVKPAVLKELKKKLEAGEFTTVQAARRWLKKAHRIERPYASVWNWLKKFGGVLRVPRPSHSKKNPQAAEAFKEELGAKLQSLGLEAGSRVKLWVMDEARFGLHTELRRVWTQRGRRPVVEQQIRYQWDYLYGALSLLGGEAHFAHLPGVSLEWDAAYLADLAATAPEAIHVVLRDQAGFHLRDGDARLPAHVRIVDLPPYSPELNPCEQLWDLVKDEIANRVFASVGRLRLGMKGALQRFWDDAKAVLTLIGRPWMHAQVNASPNFQMSL
jgi:transposase